MRLAISLVAVLAACGDDGGPAPGGDACGATATLISPFGDHATETIDDVTGDGSADVVTVTMVGQGSYRLTVGDGAAVALPDDAAFLIAAGAADLDGDGQGDLVLGLPWRNRVLVFRGPLAGSRAIADALLTIDGPPRDGGLAPLYGAAVLVADVDLDGHRDVVIGAPAEREEGCLGQLAPRVHLGPFVDGAVVTEADVDLLLDGATRSCLAEQLGCFSGGLQASATGGPVCYRFPLTSPAPSACDA